MCRPNPQADAARVNADDCTLIEEGIAKMAPSRSATTPDPARPDLDGTVVVGSGNRETPCWRMHCATRNILAIVCVEACVVEPGLRGPPPGRSFPHFACAALKLGDEGSMPALSLSPPAGLGSGKLGTPSERMQLAKATTAC